MKKKLNFWIILIVIVIGGIAGTAVYLSQCNWINNKPYYKYSKNLRLSGQELESTDFYKGFNQLESIDFGVTNLSVKQLEALQEELPDCKLEWKTDIKGVVASKADTSLDLTNTEGLDLKLLKEKLEYLPSLNSVALSQDTLKAEELAVLVERFPNISFNTAFEIGGRVEKSDATNIKVTGSKFDFNTFVAQVVCMPKLKTADLLSQNVSDAEMEKLAEKYPDVFFIWNYTIYGKTFATNAETINLDKSEITNLDEFKKSISYFKNLKRAEMNDCGLSNDQMGELVEMYPETKFVWTIKFSRYRVKTDAIAFSTAVTPGVNSPHLKFKNVEGLKYCTEMEALDLGHNEIEDISFIGGMKNLKILIVADNKVKDISVLANLKELVYIELFLNDIEDTSVFKELPNLKDLNICHNSILDPSPLYECKQLERLWIARNRFWDSKTINALRAALPNCKFSFWEYQSTGEGWRRHPRYYWMRDYFGLGYM
ncbi:MAG: hypothetical protein LBS74_06795 [Oscillospiraceae bacterium]|jgi:Leucine-rich repeat (LRR) protein|nr:hypothetical protein [Oscillospiraceae bacterium]